MTEDEKARNVDSSELAADMTLLFSAKEAVYKAVNPIVGNMIDYRQCDIRITSPGFFAATYVGSTVENRIMDSGGGCYFQTDNWVITGFVIDSF